MAFQLNQAIGKVPLNGNPVVANRYGADPYALVFGDRVYLYMTNDALEYDGNGVVKENTYSSINKIAVISSSDLVNWTDHGEKDDVTIHKRKGRPRCVCPLRCNTKYLSLLR